MDNVINLSKITGDAAMQSPKQALEDALEEIESNEIGGFKDCKKLMVLALNDDDQYTVSFIQAGMKMSQCLTMCEVAKTIFLNEMGYLDGRNDD